MTVESQIAEAVRAVVREELERALGARAPAELLTTEQAASLAGVTPKTIRGWVAQGLPVVRRGRRILIQRSALLSWNREGPRQGPAAILSTLTGGAR